MIKRIFSAFICIAIVFAAFSISASAESINRVDVKVGDVKVYVDEYEVEKGDFITVTLYLENITLEDGVLAVDFPLSYDRSKLSYVKMESIYPASWGPYGAFFGHATPDEDPWYLRSIPDAGDLGTDPGKYKVTEDQQIGFKLSFRAVAEGEAFISVENAENKPIMLVATEGADVVNYGGNGMTVKVQIGGEDSSSDTPVVPDDSSEDESSAEPDDGSSEDSSVDEESEESSADESIEESSAVAPDASGENSVSDPSVDTDDSSASDTTGSDSAEASTEDSASADDGEKDESKGGFWIPVLIVVVAAAALGLGGFIFMKKKSTKAEEE